MFTKPQIHDLQGCTGSNPYHGHWLTSASVDLGEAPNATVLRSTGGTHVVPHMRLIIDPKTHLSDGIAISLHLVENPRIY